MLKNILIANEWFMKTLLRSGLGSADTLRAKSEVFARVFETMAKMDARSEALRGTSILPQIGQILLRRINSPLAETSVDDILWGANWIRDSAPTFILTAGVAANLMLTDPGKILESDIAWPFPAFRVVLPHPDCEVNFSLGDGVTMTRMRSINVLDWSGGNVPINTIDIQGLYTARNDASWAFAWSKVLDHIMSIMNEAKKQRVIITRAYADNIGVSVFANQIWRGDAPVSDWMKVADHELGNTALRTDSPLVSRDRIAMSVAQRIVVNLALYLTSHEKSGEPLWTQNSKGQGRSGRNWTIGQAVKVDSRVREAATTFATGVSVTAPTIAHIVRGHFREQPCGPGRQERRRIYISPFWRGSENTTARERAYEVR